MDFRIIVAEQREELEDIERRENIIERSSIGKAKNFLKYPNILAVTGIRRCGKSVFSYLTARNERFGYINFDDERLSNVNAADLDKILGAFYELYGDVEYVILDEIQNVEKWELFANRLRRTKKVIVTGSNSRLLSGEFTSHLTGRHIALTIYPFSFSEFLNFKKFDKKNYYTAKNKAALLKLLREYLSVGGFPEVYKFGKSILHRLFNDIITKDILLRHKIKKSNEIKMLANYLITNFTGEISYSRMVKLFNIKHVSTLSKWLSYLEESFLIFKLQRFSFKLKEQYLATKKVFAIDNGIILSTGFLFGENSGKLMENCVAVELQRKVAEQPGMEIYYWKDYRQHEVDFIIKNAKHVEQLIQVTWATTKEEIKEREVKSLVIACDELYCRNLLIITWDYESEAKISGKKITFIPLWKWLTG